MNDNQLIYEAYTAPGNAEGVTDELGNKFWFKNHKLHRVGGPAAVYVDGQQTWMQRGMIHREDGPAVINPTQEGISPWYLWDEPYEEMEAWAEAVLKMHHKPHDADAVAEFLRPILQKQTKEMI